MTSTYTLGDRIVNRVGVSRPPERPVWPESDHPALVFDATTRFAPLIPGSTWLIGDSFGWRSRQELSRFFDELVVVPYQALGTHTLDDLAAELGHGPDAIVVEHVQRNVARDWWELPLDAVSSYVTP